MPHDYRNRGFSRDQYSRRTPQRSGHYGYDEYRADVERNRYEAGGEPRFAHPQDESWYGQYGSPEGDRAYATAYPEDSGSRSSSRDESRERLRGSSRDDAFGFTQREDYRPENPDAGQRHYSRGEFRGNQERGFGEWNRPSGADEFYGAASGEGFHGTGHYGGDAPYRPSGYGEVPFATARDPLLVRPEARYGELYGGRRESEPHGSYESPSGQSSGAQLSHRGRGPKGYVRSDERLREIICERLTDDHRIDASDVNIEVRNQVVKLSGSIADRRSKYEIEDLIEHIGGITDIENQLRVQPSQVATSAQTRSGTSMGAADRAPDKSAASAGTSASGKRS